MFRIYEDRTGFYQWDLNQKLIVSDNTITEVHFCNKTDDCSLVCEVYAEGSLRLVDVPNILLQTNLPIRAYGYSNDSYTKDCEVFDVTPRTKPADYVYTETEVKSFEALEQKVAEIPALPVVTTEDNGKIMQVVDGNWVAVEADINSKPKIVGTWRFKDSLYGEDYDGIRHKVNFTSGGNSYTEMYADTGEAIFYDDNYVMSGGWAEYPQYQIVDFGAEEQELTEEFINWFTSVAAPYESDEKVGYLSGLWKFNDSVDNYWTGETHSVNFTSNGESFTSIRRDGGWALFYNETFVYTGSWANDANPNYQYLDFGAAEQLVDLDFYYWFTANATKVTLEDRVVMLEEKVALLELICADLPVKISGTWKWNNDVRDYWTGKTYNVNFTSNGENFTGMYCDSGYMLCYDNNGNQIGVYTGSWSADDSIYPENNIRYQTITFKDTQSVDREFYNWFTANATKQ